jgi:hypothetical protein
MSGTVKGPWAIALVTAGFTAWAVVFLALYGMQAVGCRLDWHRVAFIGSLSVQRAVQTGIYIAALAMTALLYRWMRDQTRTGNREPAHRFLTNVAARGGLAALGAVAFCFAGVIWLSTC